MTSTLLAPSECLRRAPLTASVCVFVLLGLLASTGAFAGKQDRLPYEVGFHVVYGQQAGPESWREELEFLVIEYLNKQQCFEVIRRFDPENPGTTDLLIDVLVAHVEESQDWDISEAALYDPDRPPETENMFTLELEADFQFEFRKLPEDVVVRRKRFRAKSTYRPKEGEDPRYEIRLEVIKDIERELISMICKGPEKKLVRDIEAALAKAGN